jgi:hypothetical protein
MCCGGVLREALKYDAIAALILYDEPNDGAGRDLASVDPAVPSSGNGVFWRFFDWIDTGAFEATADAFSTFRVNILPRPLARHLELTGQTGNTDPAQAADRNVPADQLRPVLRQV